MRVPWVLSCLLATVHGLGDVFPYTNTAGALYSDQKSAPWTNGVCTSGKKQSPIDVVTSELEKPKEDPGKLTLSAYDQSHSYMVEAGPMEAYLTHVDSVTPIPFVPLLSGGPLPPGVSYAFNHIEFRWGTDNSVGSEHSIDGVYSPLEIQCVHYTTTSPSFAEAVTAAEATPDPAAIVVLTFQFEIDTSDNAALTPILDTMEGGYGPTPPVKISELINPATPGNVLEEYYYYDGSLTLPADTIEDQSCLEIVRWIVFPTKLKISQEQLDKLRALTDIEQTEAGAIKASTTFTANTRLVQDNSNTVYHRKTSTTKIDNTSGTILGATLLGVGTFGAVYNYLTGADTSKALTANPVVDFLQNIEERFISPPIGGEERVGNHHHHPQDVQY